MTDVAPPRGGTLMHAGAFVGGFSITCIILGASLGIVGDAPRMMKMIEKKKKASE